MTKIAIVYYSMYTATLPWPMLPLDWRVEAGGACGYLSSSQTLSKKSLLKMGAPPARTTPSSHQPNLLDYDGIIFGESLTLRYDERPIEGRSQATTASTTISTISFDLAIETIYKLTFFSPLYQAFMDATLEACGERVLSLERLVEYSLDGTQGGRSRGQRFPQSPSLLITVSCSLWDTSIQRYFRSMRNHGASPYGSGTLRVQMLHAPALWKSDVAELYVISPPLPPNWQVPSTGC
jgi:hypothetical protein